MSIFVNPDIASTVGVTYAGGGWSVLNSSALNNLLSSTSSLAVAQRDSAAATLALASMTGVNKLVNGSFENSVAGANGALNGWTREGAAGATTAALWPSNGVKALSLGGWSAGSGAVSQEISTVAGSAYTLTFMAAASGEDQRLVISLSSRESTTIKDFQVKEFTVSGSDKKYYTYTFTAPTALTTVRLWVAGSAGDLAIDDVRLVENAKDPNQLLQSGEFEDGDKGNGKVENWDVEYGAGRHVDPNRASSGTGLLALGGWTDGAGAISQYNWAEAGAVYALSFDAKGFRVDQKLRVTVTTTGGELAGKTLVDESFVVSSAAYAKRTLTFTGLGTGITIRFSADGSTGDCDLDNIQMVKVLGGLDKVSNGDFEDGDTGNGAAVDGWDVNEGGAAIWTDAARASGGERFLALGGWTDGGGKISQSLETRAGAIYSLSFAASAYNVSQNLNVKLIASDGSVVLSQSLTVSGTQSKVYSFTFKATSSTTDLAFTVADSAGDLDLDCVSVVRVGGLRDEWSEEATKLYADLYLAGSADLVKKALDELGADFQDADKRQAWMMDYYDDHPDDHNRSIFDEEEYLLKNPDVAAKWIDGAAEHYLRYGYREGRNAPTCSQAAAILNADAFIAGSPDLIALAKKELGANFSNENQRSSWARKYYDTHANSSQRALFDAEVYALMYTDVANSPEWGENATEHFLLQGAGRYAPTEGSPAATLDADAYLAGSTALIAEAKLALGARFTDDTERTAWTLRKFAAGGYNQDYNLFDEETYALTYSEQLTDWTASAAQHFLMKGSLAGNEAYLISSVTGLSVKTSAPSAGAQKEWDTPYFDQVFTLNNGIRVSFGYLQGEEFFAYAMAEPDSRAKFQAWTAFASEAIEMFRINAIAEAAKGRPGVGYLTSFARTYDNEKGPISDTVQNLNYGKSTSNEAILKSLIQVLQFIQGPALELITQLAASYVKFTNSASEKNLLTWTQTKSHLPILDRMRYFVRLATYLGVPDATKALDKLNVTDAQASLRLSARRALVSYGIDWSKEITQDIADKKLPNKTAKARLLKVLDNEETRKDLKSYTEIIQAHGNRWNLVILRLLTQFAKFGSGINVLNGIETLAKTKTGLKLVFASTMAALTLGTMMAGSLSAPLNVQEGLRIGAGISYLVTSSVRFMSTLTEAAIIKTASALRKLAGSAEISFAEFSTAAAIASSRGESFAVQLNTYTLAGQSARVSGRFLARGRENIIKLAKLMKALPEWLGPVATIAASVGDLFTSGSQVLQAMKAHSNGRYLSRDLFGIAAATNLFAGLAYITSGILLLTFGTTYAGTVGIAAAAGLVLSIAGASFGSWATSVSR